MGRPIIGYENHLESTLLSTLISSPAAAAGFEPELSYNWKTYDGWRSGTDGVTYLTATFSQAVTVDYWAASGHDLGTNAGSIKLQYSATGAWAGEEVDFDTAVSPTDDTTIMQYTTTPISAQYWRWEVTSTPASFFAILTLGSAMQFVRAVRVGFPLPTENRDNKIINSRAEGGAFLGRSLVRKGIETDFRIEIQTLDYGRTTWHDFLDHAELKPFIFCWNTAYLEDSIFAWTDKDPQPVTFDRNNTVRMGLRMKGLY